MWLVKGPHFASCSNICVMGEKTVQMALMRDLAYATAQIAVMTTFICLILFVAWWMGYISCCLIALKSLFLPGDFMCKDRTKCIDRKLVCDGRFQCFDHSDELGCPTTAPTTTTKASLRCRVGSKPCRNGHECVLHSHVCDGETDCEDGSDETDCDFNCEAGNPSRPFLYRYIKLALQKS